MQVHSNAATNASQRTQIRQTDASRRAKARRLAVAPSTVQRWKKRDSVFDRSSRPDRLRSGLSQECKNLVLKLRMQGLTLDECLDALRPEFPGIARSTLHRFLANEGLSRLSQPKDKRRGKFKDYRPGFVHIDLFYLPAIGAKKRYCFIAIDRNTRLSFLKVYDSKTKTAAKDFLERVLAFFPFQVYRLLTDNGSEFTNRLFKRAPAGPKAVHPLDVICDAKGIQRRFTKPYTPATNGMAERFVGLCKKAIVSAHRYCTHEQIEQHLDQWLGHYNKTRPHGGIGRKTPIQKAIEGYKQDPALFTRDPALLFESVPNLLGLDS